MVTLIQAIGQLKNNIGLLGAGTAGAIAGGVVGYAAGSRVRRKKARKSKKAGRGSRRSSRHKRGNMRFTPHTARKRRDTSHRRIRYTKNGQPYVILGSGRARFIKKKNARTSHKRAGGRY